MTLTHAGRGPRLLVILALCAGMEPASALRQDVQEPVSAVPVSAWVLDRAGEPVADLQAQDFQVTVDGRPRVISSLAIRQATSSASGGVSRRIVFAVNRPSLAPGADRRLLEGVAALLDRFAPTDLAAVWPIPADRAQLVFTSNRSVTRAALLAATGAKPAAVGRHVLSPAEAASIARGNTMALETAAERACPQAAGARDEVARCREELRREAALQVDQARAEAEATGGGLRPLVRALQSVGGTKHLVMLTGGVAFSDELGALARAIASESAAGRVTIHTVQVPQPGGGGGSRSDPDGSFELVLARETGGLAIAGLDAAAAVERLERTLGAEYTLAFVPEASERDGGLHQLDVRVSRRGTHSVRAPRQVRIDPATPADTPAVTSAPSPAPVAPGPEPASPPEAAPPVESAAGPPPPETSAAEALPSLSADALIERAGEYVRRYEQSMSAAVLEERYVQVVKPWSFPPKQPDVKHLEWADDIAKVRPDVVVSQRRQTKSDVLLVQLPNQMWAAFRDTYEVNGRLLRDHEDRLRTLFLEQSENSREQLRRINYASSEWNLGEFYREINLPTAGLIVAHPTYRPNFAFQAAGVERVGDVPCRVVSFKETAKDTLIRSRRPRRGTAQEVLGKSIPLSGSLCIDGTGAIQRTRLQLDSRYTMRGAIEVVYRPNERVPVLVPERMWEWYELPEPDERGVPRYVETMATYRDFRQFTVTTDEQVK